MVLSVQRLGVLAVLALLITGAAGAVRAEGEKSGATDRQSVEEIVRQYLLANPEVIVEAMEVLRKRQEDAEAQRIKSLISERSKDIFESPDAPIDGNTDGDVTLVEFFDYQCGYCKRAFPDMMKVVREDGNVRLVFKEFPILGPASVYAAKAALASREQGKYVPFHQALMEAKGQLSEDRVLKIATSVGLDGDALVKSIKDKGPEYDRIIQKNRELAQDLGITGTPAYLINDIQVPGLVDYETMKKLVARARELAAEKKAAKES